MGIPADIRIRICTSLALLPLVFDLLICATESQRESFSVIFDRMSEITWEPASQIVITHNKARVYSFGTPHALRLYKSAVFQGYTIATYTKLQAMKLEAVGATSPVAPRAEMLVDDAEASASSVLVRLTIRGSATQALPLAVKSTTSIATLLKQYSKTFGIEEKRRKNLWLEFDGERLGEGVKICDIEVEDEDTLEVKESRS